MSNNMRKVNYLIFTFTNHLVKRLNSEITAKNSILGVYLGKIINNGQLMVKSLLRFSSLNFTGNIVTFECEFNREIFD